MSVSVVIPAHNAGAFIDESIQSILAQTWPADEIIVVNDGSTDRDYDALVGLASNIRVDNQPNRGVSAARNRGCELATSDYIAILDADDVWLPGKLRTQMMHLGRQPATDAVFCMGMYWRPEPGSGTWVRPILDQSTSETEVRAEELHYEDFLYGIPVASSTMVIKKHVWQAIGGFDECMKYAEDQQFNLRLSRNYRVDLLKFVGMLYRQHSDSATARIQDQNHWADVTSGAVKALGLIDASGARVDAGKLRRRLAQLHFFHGYDHFWRGRLPVARREFWQALLRDPLDAKTVAYLLVLAIPGLPRLLKKRPSGAGVTNSSGGLRRRRPSRARGMLDEAKTPYSSSPPR
jgi:hypothetical protein